jgi:hypothetical protein
MIKRTLLLSSVTLFLFCQYSQKHNALSITNTSLGKYTHLIARALSTDNNHLAFVSKDTNGQFLVYDGKAKPSKYKIHEILLSPDGKHLAYSYSDSAGHIHIVKDSVDLSGPFADICAGTMEFSNDSKHLAYGAIDSNRNDIQQVIMVDSNEYYRSSQHNESIMTCNVGSKTQTIFFNQNCNKIAFVVQKGNLQHLVIIDFKARIIDTCRQYNQIHFDMNPFCNDNRTIAYYAISNDEFYAIVGDQQLGPYKSYPSNLKFNSDCNKFAFIVDNFQGKLIVRNGNIEPTQYPLSSSAFDIYFSPDFMHYAYESDCDKGYFIVYDRQRYKNSDCYDHVGGPIMFSGNSQRFAFTAQKQGKWFVVVDKEKGKSYDFVEWSLNSLFSPDSKHFIYIAQEGKYKMVILDNKESPKYDNVGFSNQVFSSDGAHYAYCIEKRKKKHVLIDGKEGPGFEDVAINSIKFSPNNNHIAYVATINKQQIIVVDNERTQQYDNFVVSLINDSYSYFSFIDSSLISAIASKNSEFFKLTIHIPD